ncbi:MAG TPA: tetratricopeptide repeat protein [Fimbriimonadaceae bacterium]|nr:tetratricopeptide repeat protein [Fimbriimonadaceae bacterium]
MKLIGLFLAFALVAIATAQKITLDINAKNGDVISGEKHFVVTVQSKNPVTHVEFYVGSDLRDTDSSTPYEFNLDTLGESDGDLKVKFVAYTSEGESAASTLDLSVDNEVSKGAAYHLAKAKDFLAVSKWDDAITQGRIALKADKDSVEARIDLARAYMGKDTWDRAQKYAEDASTADPKNLEALELVAAIDLNRVFSTVSRTDDSSGSLSAISEALKAAVTARRKSLDQQIDNFGPVTDANRLAYCDLVMRGSRYTLAISQLDPIFRLDPKNNAVADRLIFACLREGRLTEARQDLNMLEKFGTPDAYGNALEAVYDAQTGDDDKAASAMKDALLNDPDNLGVKSAQAYIALRQGRKQVLSQAARDLASTDSQLTEVNYFLAALYNRLADPSAEKYFRRSVLIEPTNYDMYIEWANYAIGLAVSGRLEEKGQHKEADAEVAYAKVLFDAAVLADPSSSQALTGECLVALYQNRIDDAVKYGKAATQAAPQYAAAHYVYSAAATAKATSIHTLGLTGSQATALQKLQDDMTRTAARENDLAGKLDQLALSGAQVPTVAQAWAYFTTGGRTVVMVPPGP